MVDDTWVITCYFNPLGYRSRRENFDHFARSLATQGGRLLVIELSGRDGGFDLDTDAHRCVRVHGEGFIWQKERMLNIGLRHLPPECTKVVWADGDLIFERSDWLEATSSALDDDVVVQPFDRCLWLPEHHLAYRGDVQEGGEERDSFAACYRRDAELSRREVYANHGHTGFAWGARRDFLDSCGFYDGCITGSGDHLMAHVFANSLESPCIPRMIGEGHGYARHFDAWATRANAICQGKLGCVPGRVLHLWHGSLENRQYYQRNQEFKRFDFDPARDLRVGPGGLWEWAEASSTLRDWAVGGFRSRDEDGVGAATTG